MSDSILTGQFAILEGEAPAEPKVFLVPRMARREPRPPTSPRRSAAFTITEVLVAVAILLILVTAIMSTYVFSIWGFQSITNYVQLHMDGRTAVNQFLTDMRGVSSVVSFSANGPFVVTVATNYDQVNHAIMTATATYTFSATDPTLSRRDSRGTMQLATNVNLATFTMYDHNNTNTTVISNAKSVQLDLAMSNRVVNLRQTEDYLSARTVMRNTP